MRIARFVRALNDVEIGASLERRVDRVRRVVSFQHVDDGRKLWKLSPMDLLSYSRWYDYARARDEMFVATDTEVAPWWVVRSDDKRRARLNCIRHLLSLIPYKDVTRPGTVKLPKRQEPGGYRESPHRFKYVPGIPWTRARRAPRSSPLSRRRRGPGERGLAHGSLCSSGSAATTAPGS